MSLLISIVASCYWGETSDWATRAIDVIPSILGFSLGGYAIFLAFGSPKFIRLISEKDTKKSYYLKLNALFVHFILVQIISILLAVAGIAVIGSDPGKITSIIGYIVSSIGFLAFIYALLTALATAFELFRLARLFHEFNIQANDEPQRSQKEG